MKYFYFYKITNNINNHFYYGVHCTNNLNDNYMGSGKRLQYAIKKYGIENFSKEILKYFNSKEEAFEYEEQIVNENLVNNPNCYNLTKGGHGSWLHNKGKVTVKDKFGNTFDVNKDDPRYISGELVYIHKGTTTVKDKHGNCFRIKIDDPRYISGELISVNKNVPKKKSSVEKMRNSLKEYYKTHKGYSLSGKDHQYYGTTFVTKNNKSIRIKKEELNNYLNQGWEHKRICGNYKGKIYIHRFLENDEYENKAISKNELNEYVKNGWIKGQYKPNAKSKFKRKYICKLIDNKLVLKIINIKDLEKYVQDGWTPGKKLQ